MNHRACFRSTSHSHALPASRIPICLVLGVFLLSGCELLSWSTLWLGDGEGHSSAESHSNVLRKIPTSKTAVALEILFVERPINDPLLGSQLWDEVDQIGSLPPDERKALEEAGFRVGRVGANPPLALQTLMGLSTDLGAKEERRLVGHPVRLPSGAETEINTGVLHPQCTIKIPLPDGTETRSFENVRGIFRMKASRLQDGWARIEFLPEIHHGQIKNRPVAVAGEWQVPTTQAVEKLYCLKFTLDLNLGEMVVITGEPEPKDTVGSHFFHAPEFTDTLAEALSNPEAAAAPSITPNGIQRLLIVRLADLSTAKSLYSVQQAE